jgi:hypothetical protein
MMSLNVELDRSAIFVSDFTCAEQLFLKFLYTIAPYAELVRYCVIICDLLNTARKCVEEETVKIGNDDNWTHPKSALIGHIKDAISEGPPKEPIFRECYEVAGIEAVLNLARIYSNEDAKLRPQTLGMIKEWPVDVKNVFFKLLAKFKQHRQVTIYLELNFRSAMNSLLQTIAPVRQLLMWRSQGAGQKLSRMLQRMSHLPNA